MCGIAGHFGTISLSDKRINDCLSRMRQRGPDHAGRYHHGAFPYQVTLLHTRLSIIDLNDRSNQPLRHGPYTLIYNGELYNYIELKAMLQRRGILFRTHSDTEVFLQILIHFGWKGLDRCEGMWAFALYNEADGSLMLGRDRFGEKPLYLLESGKNLFFGSEIKFIQSLIDHSLEIDLTHCLRYLVNGYRSLYKQDSAFFKGIRSLSPATILTQSQDGNVTNHRYWALAYTPNYRLTQRQIIEETKNRLIQAMRIRLRSDVPIAFCMSGGIDSTSLMSIAVKMCDYDVHGFTIINTDTRYKESELIQHMVDTLGLKHTPIPLKEIDFLNQLKSIVAYHDAPVYTISYYLHWLLIRAIAEDSFRISISGTGADELFTGYFDHHLLYLAAIQSDQSLWKESRSHWQDKILPFIRNPLLKDPNRFIQNTRLGDHIYLDRDRFRHFLTIDFNEAFTETPYCNDILRRRMLNELFHEVVPVILHEDDLNAMYFSVENRSPFLDRSLAEFLFTVPTQFLIQNGYTKSILREAMRGIVPDKILDNPRKVGFNAPFMDLFNRDDPILREYLLDGGDVFHYVKQSEVASLYNKPCLENSESKFLFNVLCFKIFLEHATYI